MAFKVKYSFKLDYSSLDFRFFYFALHQFFSSHYFRLREFRLITWLVQTRCEKLQSEIIVEKKYSTAKQQPFPLLIFFFFHWITLVNFCQMQLPIFHLIILLLQIFHVTPTQPNTRTLKPSRPPNGSTSRCLITTSKINIHLYFVDVR